VPSGLRSAPKFMKFIESGIESMNFRRDPASRRSAERTSRFREARRGSDRVAFHDSNIS
jgi:hypothetical protein